MKKKLVKSFAVMLCLILVLTACSKVDTDKGDDKNSDGHTVTVTPDKDKPADVITNVPTTVAVTDVPATGVINEYETIAGDKKDNTLILTDGSTETSPTEPTVGPTLEPTVEPTLKPTLEPTAKPTAEPTAKPTAEPTLEPTAKPTAEPTPEPVVDDDIGELNLSGIPMEGKSLSDEEVLSLAKAISKASNSKKRYLYLDSAMSMDFGGQPMDVIMNETVYVNGNILHLNTYTNIYGSDTNIESYSVGNDDGTTESYTSYNGGATWYKSNDNVLSIGSPFDSDYEEYADFLIDAYIIETASGYTVTCQICVDEDGLTLLLDCEIYLDTEGLVTGYKMSLSAPIEEEIDGMDMVMSKYDIEFETNCPEIELPAEALNAKEYDVNDRSGLLDGIDY